VLLEVLIPQGLVRHNKPLNCKTLGHHLVQITDGIVILPRGFRPGRVVAGDLSVFVYVSYL
jgi:hypothetical protein